MSVRRLSKSYISGGRDAGPKSSSFLASYSPAIDEMDLISRVSLSASAASIEFTSIPQTYQHLQVRMIGRSNRADVNENVGIQLNGSTASNYAYHAMRGDGSLTASESGSAQAQIELNRTLTGNNATASAFGAFILDILDYGSSSKATTVRGFGGYENNGSGQAVVSSGLWTVTDAISSVKIFPRFGSNWSQDSITSLYGIKA